jgi:hypothetical protein
MRRRTLSTTLAISIYLLTAHTAFADSVDFQTAVGSSGAQSGGTPTSQSGGTTSQGSGTTGSQVQTVDIGDVTGTVCDCGEIAPAGETHAAKGGFPKFPLLALAVLPIACPVIFCHDTPPPNPPNPPNVPEPLTLATFAAGLAALAGLRSRRGK